MAVQTSTMAKEILPDGVLCGTPEGDVIHKADTIVVALGMRPLWDETEALSGFDGEFYAVGDCRAPRNILAATGDGWTAARNIGRR